jgi:hypothetical protein
MIVPKPPPEPPPFAPEAVITREGRWIYHINITDGLMGLNSPRIAFGRRHAEWCARRTLAWYVRKFGPPRESWTIKP